MFKTNLFGTSVCDTPFNAGGVRTLIALHHGRKTKSKSFAFCHVNISGGSENVMEIHCLLPFLRKLKSVIPPWQIRYWEATEEIQKELKLQSCP